MSTTTPGHTSTPARTSRTVAGAFPHRWVLAVTCGFTALGAAGGAQQLISGGFGMSVDDLEPLGLDGWVLPGLWLFASVAVPCATATVLALRRNHLAPLAALIAAVLLAVELVVQIPFVGSNPLQVVFGGVAFAVAALALDSRRRGWR